MNRRLITEDERRVTNGAEGGKNKNKSKDHVVTVAGDPTFLLSTKTFEGPAVVTVTVAEILVDVPLAKKLRVEIISTSDRESEGHSKIKEDP